MLSRLTRESLFFACAKKSNQKKAHPGGTPSALRAPGAQAGRTFFGGTSMCRRKTARILRAAPAGFLSGLLAVPHGIRNSQSQSDSQSNSQSNSNSQSSSNSQNQSQRSSKMRRRYECACWRRINRVQSPP
ncbi:hypothetical protein [uncultured Xanthomonas sp.]|uniref:hypothetical protein n=1 Tax=uncultured Xanthomonas sp. TaxID=152831 RepID=UPI0025FED8AB|nr:hypothetical protein [uncultured Xanthomonas sp.]